MFNRLLRWRIAAFERRYDYDMDYARKMLGTNRSAFIMFSRASRIARIGDGLPPAALFAAKLATSIAEDCGPCTQLIVAMAEEARVPVATIRAVVTGDVDSMDADTKLSWNFTQAVLAHDVKADAYRDEVIQRWGERAVISLALLIAGTRMFPTIKYAMGYGKSCQRVRVGNMHLPGRSTAVPQTTAT
jgi:hypothetical protein